MPNPCCQDFYASIPEDEPVFTLAGRDQLAVETVEFWIEKAKQKGVNENKIARAIRHRDWLVEFQTNNPERTKLPD